MLLSSSDKLRGVNTQLGTFVVNPFSVQMYERRRHDSNTKVWQKGTKKEMSTYIDRVSIRTPCPSIISVTYWTHINFVETISMVMYTSSIKQL